jgi:MHS family shikimate/dehydroshikimate transporter-like MFS transporter
MHVVVRHPQFCGGQSSSGGVTVTQTIASSQQGRAPETTEERVPLSRKDIRGAMFASVVGNTLEWYDFFIYGTASALVFGQQFFPVGEDPSLNTLVAFAGYSIGFFARPLGGLIFGHVGDRMGRKAALVWTLTLMGVATFAMGLLPTYHDVGNWAPVMLVMLRVLQGIATGGEWGGGVLMATENAPAGRRGFFGACTQSGVGLGFVLASLAFYFARKLPGDAFMEWGWRLPFLASFAIFIVGIIVRFRVKESRDFRVVEEDHAVVQSPAKELVRNNLRELVLGVGMRLAEQGGSHLMITFSLAYAAFIGAPLDVMLLSITVAMVCDSLMMPVFGALSDKIGRHVVYAFGAISLGLFGYPFFLMLGSGSTLMIMAALIIGNAICHAAMVGVAPALFTELFNTRVRYSGLSIVHEVSSIVVGAAPLIATALFRYYHSPVPIAIYLAVLCAISAASALMLRKEPGATAQ